MHFCRVFVQEEFTFLQELEEWVLKVASDERHLSTPIHFIMREFFRTCDQFLQFVQHFVSANKGSYSWEIIEMWNQKITSTISKIVTWYTETYHEFSAKRLQSQQELINELSLPVISLSRNVSLLPLVENIDTTRAKYILKRILKQCFELPPTYLTVEVGDSWARGSSTPSNQANPVFQRFYDQT
ncbi:hypothetical protein M3221_16065 [Domibacillus indicus]|uniref:hypothetical protein n=1 Tax=Domibacillus indicus TaxID=1437523 RepID=UPI00203BE254|nr:hypothetical protein [Domibacillus indicus]MCM3789908.1 hypothetical protein [Domibacillus indicus]